MSGLLQRHHTLLALIILLGAVLRLYAIGSKTVWLDEAFSIWVANHPQPEIWRWLIRIDQHPPLYYSLLALWQGWFGDLQGTVRILSALGSILAIPLLYATGWRLTGERSTGLLAAALLAISPFHVRFAQEARMYALLTLSAAAALYCLVRILGRQPAGDSRRHSWERGTAPSRRRWLGVGRSSLWWFGLAVSQAAVMLTHNTAAVFFPLAANLPILGALFYRRRTGRPSSLPGLNQPHFLRFWIRTQLLALLLWSPWAVPFVLQSARVDQEFWLWPPTMVEIWGALRNFNFAHLPGDFPWTPVWMALYWGLAAVGAYRLRRRPAWGWLLLSLFLTPFLGELLVSLRRPIFYDRTLIWTTVPYYLLVAAGIGSLRLGKMRLPLQATVLAVLVVLSGSALHNYYIYFEKEDWARAADYVSRRAQPGDVVLFNATWVQIPFEYYFRHYEMDVELRGAPVDLFDRGELEPKMTRADLPYLRLLVAGREQVWLVYSHDWYTDPDGLLPAELDRLMYRLDQKEFVGLEVIQYVEVKG